MKPATIFAHHRSFRSAYNPDALLWMKDHLKLKSLFSRQILIGGTNGKGSTTMLLSSIYQAAGYKTGTFISPHLIRYNERILVNGRPIKDSEFLAIYELLKPSLDLYEQKSNRPLSFFELMLLVAVLHFQRQNVDVSVFEAGLGARRDATMALEPDLSILTNVGLDHAHILGPDQEAIAREKAWLGRLNTPLLCGQSLICDFKIWSVLEAHAKDRGCQLISEKQVLSQVQENKDGNTGKLQIHNQSLDFFCPLAGQHQILNLNLVLNAVSILQNKLPLTPEQMIRGIGLVQHGCRLEKIWNDPLIYIDGSHNWEGMEGLLKWIQTHLKEYKILLAFSSKRNKIRPEYHTAFSSFELMTYTIRDKAFLKKQELLNLYPQGRYAHAYMSIYEAFAKLPEPKALIFTGSLYSAGIQKQYFQRHKRQICAKIK